MRPTAFSLPGMVREEKITRSPLPSEISGCSSSAMRASAARGSPWLPVHRQHDLAALQIAELVLVEMLEAFRQVAGLDRNLDHAVQRAPGDDERPAGRPGRIRHGACTRATLEENVVTATRPLALATISASELRHVALRRRAAFAEGVGRNR